jgi:hypothetical protein
MKYRIELTEEQMRVLEHCTESWMRLMMGQVMNLSDDLAFYNTYKFVDREDFKEIHSRNCDKRDVIYEILSSVMRIAFGRSYGVPDEKSEDCMIAECMWDAIRFARGTSRWNKPFQIGSEPTPKIEVIEDD